MARYYPAIIERDIEGFGVFFPDVPGCTSFGATIDEAARNAEQALQAHLDLSAEHGEPPPRASDFAALEPDPEVQEVVRLLVRADVGSKAVQVSITMPEDLLLAVDRFAEANGFTRSGLLAQTVRERIRNGGA